jgi:hypothetical protein
MKRSASLMFLTALLLILGGAVGAYLGGRASDVCVIGPSLPPGPATCDTSGLSPLGGAVGCTVVALTMLLLKRWHRRKV